MNNLLSQMTKLDSGMFQNLRGKYWNESYQWCRKEMWARLWLEKHCSCWISRDLYLGWLPWLLQGGTWIQNDCLGYSKEAPQWVMLLMDPQRWLGQLQLLNDQEGCWRTKVLSDFDVMRAEKYKGNKGSQMYEMWK